MKRKKSLTSCNSKIDSFDASSDSYNTALWHMATNSHVGVKPDKGHFFSVQPTKKNI